MNSDCFLRSGLIRHCAVGCTWPQCAGQPVVQEIFEGIGQTHLHSVQMTRLPNLSEKDQARVIIANDLFAYSCALFQRVSRRGILTTMENPSTSYFWLTDWFERSKRSTNLVYTDFQVCMYGGTRPKWTRFVGNFTELTQLDARCDNSHKHEPWRFAIGPDGQRVWATSLESKYPKQLCRFAMCAPSFASAWGRFAAHSFAGDSKSSFTHGKERPDCRWTTTTEWQTSTPDS